MFVSALKDYRGYIDSVSFYEVGSKQYETRQIFQQRRAIEELCINKNHKLLCEPQVVFSSHTSPTNGMGSSSRDRRSLQALRPGTPPYHNQLPIVILNGPDQEGGQIFHGPHHNHE
jgi:hypothetical protein